MQRLLQVKTLPLPNDFSKLDNLLFNKPEPKAKIVEVNSSAKDATLTSDWLEIEFLQSYWSN